VKIGIPPAVLTEKKKARKIEVYAKDKLFRNARKDIISCV